MHPKEHPQDAADVAPQPTEPPRHPSHRFDPPAYKPYVPSNAESGRKGRVFPTFTLMLCGMAVLIEGTMHLCAGIFQLDPIPSPIMLVLYIVTVLTIGVNAWVLNGGEGSQGATIRNSPRGLGLLIVSTVVSLLVALSAGYMFIPLIPVGGILLIAMGLGMLLWTPFFAIIALVGQLRQLVEAFRMVGASPVEVRRTVGAAGLAAVALLFWQIGRPMLAANYIAVALKTEGAEQRRALDASRPFGGDTILLDMAYKRNPSYWACLGYNAPDHGWWPDGGYNWGHGTGFFGNDNWWGQSPDETKARGLYFLLTGTPFEMAPRPESFKNNPGGFLRRGPDDVAVEETGGLVVGRKVPGLSLADSRMEWNVEERGTAETPDWTLKFKNDTDQPQEARAEILIPDEAVVHKVSLWINGVEQPARFGHPDRVRKAYQEVAVVRRRDPLLVTMPAPGHVLAQCFPVPAKGEMQIRLGFTLPVQSYGGIEFPAFGMVNFDVSDGNRRSSKEPFLPKTLLVSPVTRGENWGKPVSLFLVIDGSEGMNRVLTEKWLKALEGALNSLPPGSRVRFMRTDESAFVEKAAEWRDGKLPEFLLKKSQGGYDPVRHLANALDDAASEKMPSAVLFLHAASANGVSDLTEIRKALQKNYWNGPALVGVHMTPATPDTLIRELSGFPRVYTTRAFPDSPNFARRFYQVVGRAVRAAAETSSEAETKAQIAQVAAEDATDENITDPAKRLDLFNKVVSSWRYANTLPDAEALDVRIAAGKAAAHQNLVTPLSSAVVLETEEQYQRHGLDKDGPTDPRKMKPDDHVNPNLPEPGALALMVVGGLAAIPLLRRNRVA